MTVTSSHEAAQPPPTDPRAHARPRFARDSLALALSLSSRNRVDTTLARSPGATSLSSGTSEQRRLDFGNPRALFSRRRVPQALKEPRLKQPHASSERLSLSPHSAAVLDYLSNPLNYVNHPLQYDRTLLLLYTPNVTAKTTQAMNVQLRLFTWREQERMKVGRRL